MNRTATGQAGQFRDSHGTVKYALRLPTNGQKRKAKGLMRDYFASLRRG